MTENSGNNIISNLKNEINALDKTSGSAANTIIDATEKIQGEINQCSDEALKSNLLDNINKILEACNFQDLNGQRVKKIKEILKYMEDNASSALGCLEDKSKNKDMRKDADLMNGPQAGDNTPNQNDVDKLFDDA